MVSDQRSAPAAELLGQVADELLPAGLWPDLRQRLLVTGWLTGLRSPLEQEDLHLTRLSGLSSLYRLCCSMRG